MTILFFLSNGEIIQLEGDSATIQGSYLNSEQRQLKTIAIKSGDVYIPCGVSVPALDKDILWEFQPKKLGGWGDLLTGGNLYADTVLELEFQGVKKQYTMLQRVLDALFPSVHLAVGKQWQALPKVRPVDLCGNCLPLAN
nr:V-type proton ATPase catalytic subunit A [Ipomoea batatas]